MKKKTHLVKLDIFEGVFTKDNRDFLKMVSQWVVSSV